MSSSLGSVASVGAGVTSTGGVGASRFVSRSQDLINVFIVRDGRKADSHIVIIIKRAVCLEGFQSGVVHELCFWC